MYVFKTFWTKDRERKTINLKISDNLSNRRKAEKIKDEIEATVENQIFQKHTS